MNKYQSALTNLHNRAMRGGDRDGKIIKQTKTLQELVNKATPKKPYTLDSVPHARCPVCRKGVKMYENSIVYPYCHHCGQRLDWSE